MANASLSHPTAAGAPRFHAQPGPGRATCHSRVGVLIGHGAITGLVVLLALFYPVSGIGDEALIYGSSLLLAALFVWSLWSWRASTGSLFDPYVLFLLTAYLFHAGQAFLEIFGLNSRKMLDDRYSSGTLVATLVLVMLGLALFHLGALVVAARQRRASPGDAPRRTAGVVAHDLRGVGWCLVAISIIPAIFVLKDSFALRTTSAYVALYQQERITGLDNWLIVLATFLMPGALFLLAGSKGNRFGIVVSGLCVSALALAWLCLGARSSATMPVIAYAWVYHTCVRPIPKLLLTIGGATILLVVFPLVGYLRADPLSQTLSSQAVRDAYVSIDSPAISIVSEMGSSMRTVAGTLDRVPSSRPYDLGIGYLHALMNVFPNFIPFLHFDLEYDTPDIWFVNVEDPQLAARGGALGYSFIAEAYLAFGWIGGPLLLALIGVAIARFTFWGTASMEPARIAAVGSFLAFLLHSARGTTEELVRPLLWYSLAPYLLVCLLASCRRRRHQPVSEVSSGWGEGPEGCAHA
jgi:oligosaccharide repeat unit polymerase